MRFYHVDIAQHAAGAERKWIDNLLSHFDIPGVERTQRGAPRRITSAGMYHIALARQISLELNTTVKAAVALAKILLQSETDAVPVFHGLSFKFDRRTFEASVDTHIAEAVEAVVPQKRGRRLGSRRPAPE